MGAHWANRGRNPARAFRDPRRPETARRGSTRTSFAWLELQAAQSPPDTRVGSVRRADRPRSLPFETERVAVKRPDRPLTHDERHRHSSTRLRSSDAAAQDSGGEYLADFRGTAACRGWDRSGRDRDLVGGWRVDRETSRCRGDVRTDVRGRRGDRLDQPRVRGESIGMDQSMREL